MIFNGSRFNLLPLRHLFSFCGALRWRHRVSGARTLEAGIMSFSVWRQGSFVSGDVNKHELVTSLLRRENSMSSKYDLRPASTTQIFENGFAQWWRHHQAPFWIAAVTLTSVGIFFLNVGGGGLRGLRDTVDTSLAGHEAGPVGSGPADHSSCDQRYLDPMNYH